LLLKLRLGLPELARQLLDGQLVLGRSSTTALGERNENNGWLQMKALVLLGNAFALIVPPPPQMFLLLVVDFCILACAQLISDVGLESRKDWALLMEGGSLEHLGVFVQMGKLRRLMNWSGGGGGGSKSDRLLVF
jgi:hypothetical protein